MGRTHCPLGTLPSAQTARTDLDDAMRRRLLRRRGQRVEVVDAKFGGAKVLNGFGIPSHVVLARSNKSISDVAMEFLRARR